MASFQAVSEAADQVEVLRRTWSEGCSAVPARLVQQPFEGTPKLDVEDGVDDRIQEAVDVAEPDEKRQQDRVDAADR